MLFKITYTIIFFLCKGFCAPTQNRTEIGCLRGNYFTIKLWGQGTNSEEPELSYELVSGDLIFIIILQNIFLLEI